MPFVNLAVAQATAAWIAAPNLVGFFLAQGPLFYYVVAAVGAVIVVIGAWLGARVTDAIARPTLLSLAAAVSFAIIAAGLAAMFVAPHVTQSEFAAHFYTFAPVAAAIVGYFYATRSSVA